MRIEITLDSQDQEKVSKLLLTEADVSTECIELTIIDGSKCMSSVVNIEQLRKAISKIKLQG